MRPGRHNRSRGLSQRSGLQHGGARPLHVRPADGDALPNQHVQRHRQRVWQLHSLPEWCASSLQEQGLGIQWCHLRQHVLMLRALLASQGGAPRTSAPRACQTASRRQAMSSFLGLLPSASAVLDFSKVTGIGGRASR